MITDEQYKRAIDILYAFDNEQEHLRTCLHARNAIELLREMISNDR